MSGNQPTAIKGMKKERIGTIDRHPVLPINFKSPERTCDEKAHWQSIGGMDGLALLDNGVS